MITAITPTGGRPLAFALCQRWVMNQKTPIDQWIVVDDGPEPAERLVAMDYVRREPRPDDPKHTLLLNLLAALPAIKGDKIIILEDDEYYAPGYIGAVAAELDGHEIVGLGNSKYYHLPSGGFGVIGNTWHASLSQTAFKSSFLSEFRALLVGDTYLDMRLWKSVQGRGFIFFDAAEPLYAGIKGLPGRPGIGQGHNPGMYRQKDGPGRPALRAWVPRDFQVYLDILSGLLTAENYRAYFHW